MEKFESRIHNTDLYGSGSGSSQATEVRKNLISSVLWLLYDFFYPWRIMKMYLQKINKQKKLFLLASWKPLTKSYSGTDTSGSVPKCHRSVANVTDPQHCLEEITREVEADQPRHEAQVPVAHLLQVIQAEVEEKLAQPHLHRVLGVVHNVLPKERLGYKRGGKLVWILCHQAVTWKSDLRIRIQLGLCILIQEAPITSQKEKSSGSSLWRAEGFSCSIKVLRKKPKNE